MVLLASCLLRFLLIGLSLCRAILNLLEHMRVSGLGFTDCYEAFLSFEVWLGGRVVWFSIYAVLLDLGEAGSASHVFVSIVFFWISPLNVLVDDLPVLLHRQLDVIVDERNQELVAAEGALLLLLRELPEAAIPERLLDGDALLWIEF
jgi:hypothetical protein